MTGQPPAPDRIVVHATCLAIGGWGVLLMGKPGAGKSDLALRLIDEPGTGTDGTLKRAQLVADDQVVIVREGARLFASPPEKLAGLFEVRGLGIMKTTPIQRVELALAVRLLPARDIERLPELSGQRLDLLGLSLQQIDVDAAVPSAPARIRAALDHFRGK